MDYKAQSARRPQRTLMSAILFGYAVIAIVFVACENRIIQRATGDYFPIEAGNWWQYTDENLYEPRQVFVEVESLTSIMNTDCYPVTYSGVVHYLTKDDRAVREYKELIYNFDGDDYTIARAFLTRIQLPVVEGNVYADSVRDSVNVGGVFVHGACRINGLVSGYDYNDLYGSVYKIIISTTESIIAPDTTISSSSSTEEYYAPGVGLVQFVNDEGDFHLSDYQLY